MALLRRLRKHEESSVIVNGAFRWEGLGSWMVSLIISGYAGGEFRGSAMGK